MFSTGRRVRLLQDLSTKNVLLKAGTCGHVTDQLNASLYKVQFELPRRYDKERFGENMLFTVEVLESELERA